MSNKYRPHLQVLLEDDANRQIANGFMLHFALDTRAIQVLPAAGGWEKVVERFKDTHIGALAKYPERRMLLVVDFDNRTEERINEIKQEIPSGLSERVFILGIRTEPEDLRNQIGKSFENIGQALAEDCADNKCTLWGHDLLRHNLAELNRLSSGVKPFLFN